MNKNKISPQLLNSVSVLNSYNNKTQVVISCNNFDVAKHFLQNYKYQFVPYRFANCFCLNADYDDLNIFSNQKFINYIHGNSQVKIEAEDKDLLNISALNENKFFGQGETICFIDTGITPHFDFVFPKNRIVKFIDLINKENSFNNLYDDNGHGTFVAGIACGNGIFNKQYSGYAPLANIIVIKALGENGDSNSNKILDAMQWVYENYKAYNIGIVCMSFGADAIIENDPLSKGAESLWKRGLVVVAAAGNSGPESKSIKSPGNNPYIITVGALDSSNLTIAEFSSRGPTIYGHKPDLLAPAVNIVSCNNKLTPYTKMSGTSVAAPIVAAVCAIIKCKYKNFTNQDVKNYLLAHCVKLTGDLDKEGAGYLKF